jgi:hypothetical protein
MHEALGREYHLTGAGLKDRPEFQRIYDEYADLATDEALEAARASGSAPLFEWAVDVRIGRLIAPFEERQLVWEREAVVTANGETYPYLRVPIEIGNMADRERRHALDVARARAGVGELEELRRDRLSREHEEIARLGLGDYVRSVATLSGIDLDALGRDATAFLDRTADMYRDVLRQVVHKRLGVGIDALHRSDAAWLFRGDQYDAAFDADRLLEIADGQMRELGIDLHRGGRIHFDTAEREGKQPRAFCVSVRVPDEIYLVLRPRGGHQDYRTFYHELGHAVHFASVDASLPFAARHLGDNSVTEGFAMLFDHLTIDPGWLRRFVDLSGAAARDLVFELLVQELFMLRRYAAKLWYELELHRSDLGGMGARYAEALTTATAFRYMEEDALLDVDPGFYAARYLRAWQLEAVLATSFVERFGPDWYRNPEAGEALLAVMAHGQAHPADRLATDVSGTALAFEPLVRRLEHAFD